MYDKTLLKEKLEQIVDALQRISRRFAGIETPLDFLATDVNHDKLDAISMLLIAVGESFKKIDKETAGLFLKKYPDIDWKGIIGVRNILAHDYFDIDVEEIYKICQRDIPKLMKTLEQMLETVQQ
jgi:uncharacterized protein with HEPN domain